MSVLVLMVPMAVILGAVFLAAFLKSADSGQFDELDTPAHRILQDETNERKSP